jgi:hypothetical protein
LKEPIEKAFWPLALLGLNILLVISWEWKVEGAFLFLSFFVSILTLFRLKDSPRYEIQFLAIALSILYVVGVEADDDVHRYLVEGKAVAQGISPYLVPPSEVVTGIPTQALVNHPNWTAIYGPLFLHLMAALTYMTTSVLGVKIFFVILHVLNACLIRRLRKGRWAAIYLCSPFVLFETVGQAHLEGLVVLAALLLVLGTEGCRKGIFSIGLLLALWIKWWAWPLAPIIFRRKNIEAWAIVLLSSLFILWPFLEDPEAMFVSLRNFEGLWTNGYPRLWMDWLFGDWVILPLGLVMLGLLLAVLFLGGSLHEQIWQFFRLGLLLAPTLHPWYWVMPLTMALMSGKLATFSLMGAAAMALHHPEFSLASGEGWQSSFWTVAPILVLSMLSEWRIRRHLLRERGAYPDSLTIVTPVLNEGENLRELGAYVAQQKAHVKEWIVVDGGSSDESVEIAKGFGAKVKVPGLKGRGSQIRHGVENATSDWVMVVHADTRFEMGSLERWAEAVARVPEADGGAFRMAYRGKMALGPLMFLNDLKMRWFGMSFGDQTQFFRKSSLDTRGGFPDLPLMEDVELSMTLKGGNVVYLDHLISWTSPRRWESRGRLSNTVQIIRLLMTYLWKRHWNPPVDVRAMYRSYYPS